MKGRYLRRFGALILTVLILPAVGSLFSSTTAEAQQRRIIVVRRPIYRPFHRPWGWRRPYDSRFEYYSRWGHYIFDDAEDARRQGYKDGLKTGKGDLKNDRTYNPQRSHYFKEAGFGNFGEVFRAGFLQGYADGFRA